MPDVLVVEDDPDVLDLVMYQLTVLGHEPHGVGTVAEALEVLAGRLHDLVLTDLRLGGEAAGPVVRRCLALGVPAIVMTASPGDAEVLAAEATTVLAKPVDLADLEVAVQLALERQARR